MKTSIILTFILLICLKSGISQTSINSEDYLIFRKNNKDLDLKTLQYNHPLKGTYYSEIERSIPSDYYLYFDSIASKMQLTASERELLSKNHFMITERKSYERFENAYIDIYTKDLPLFLSTDFILEALHESYDNILIDLEMQELRPNIEKTIDKMYGSFPKFSANYSHIPSLKASLDDAYIYINVAKSLLDTNFRTEDIRIKDIVEKINKENVYELKLFCDFDRVFDFSQFKVRGHYTINRSLQTYFKCMMWLGRIDLWFTAPPLSNYTSEEWKPQLQRMAATAFIINQLMDKDLLQKNEKILQFLIGKSDNFTPFQFEKEIKALKITSPEQLFDNQVFDNLVNNINKNPEYSQQILGEFLFKDTAGAVPGVLPISYKVMGQRFIIDSYILGNVVFDNIIYKNKKVLRMMPNPLDAMFALGNNDALPLLANEIEKYPYASQLNQMRYIVDSYDENFWNSSLYNCWLQSLRKLNPTSENEENLKLPHFLKTTAWHQEKLNTQLASWAHLRHNNLLYAKPSYTGAIVGCSFPNIYVEPYPDFYYNIANYASKAKEFFKNENFLNASNYFSKLENACNKLGKIADNEVNGEKISTEDLTYLKSFLVKNENQICGAGDYYGWFYDLFYYPTVELTTENNKQFIICDVHTQPTNEDGDIVGKVLHVGTGKANIGVFMVEGNGRDTYNTAFIGPVLSYYEKITDDFERLTDEDWNQMIAKGSLPERPDWTKSFLADNSGNVKGVGINLPGEVFSQGYNDVKLLENNNLEIIISPNPSDGKSLIKIKSLINSNIKIEILNSSGYLIQSVDNQFFKTNYAEIPINIENYNNGLYFVKILINNKIYTQKLLLSK